MCVLGTINLRHTLLVLSSIPDFYLHSEALKSQGINFSENTDDLEKMIHVHSATANAVTDNNKAYFPALNETKTYYATHD